jgi:hypothetical protein
MKWRNKMSLNKAIASGKERRIQYGKRGDYYKLVDKSCRNHGGCKWCEGNRTYNSRKRKAKTEVKDE